MNADACGRSGLAGLVAAELADAGRKVVVLDQEPEGSLGGQAFCSFGELFFVDSPEQRRIARARQPRLRVQDWLGSAGSTATRIAGRATRPRLCGFRGRREARMATRTRPEGYPIVGWAERSRYLATGHGNSVPRFHVTWGTGPGVIEPFVRRVREARRTRLISFRFRHRVTALTRTGSAVDGVLGDILEPSNAEPAPQARAALPVRSHCARRRSSSPRRHRAPDRRAGAQGPAGRGVLQRAGAQHRVSASRSTSKRLMLNIVEAAAPTSWTTPTACGSYQKACRDYAPGGIRAVPAAFRILSGPSPLWLDAAPGAVAGVTVSRLGLARRRSRRRVRARRGHDRSSVHAERERRHRSTSSAAVSAGRGIPGLAERRRRAPCCGPLRRGRARVRVATLRGARRRLRDPRDATSAARRQHGRLCGN